MNFDRLMALREAGYVRRLHATPTLHPHDVAQHVYGAQCIALELLKKAGADSIASKAAVLEALLYHDAPEVWTGDVPAHMKVRNPDIGVALEAEEDGWCYEHAVPTVQLTDLERKVVKAADRLDLAFHLLHERVMGCRHLHQKDIFKRVLDYVEIEGGELKGVAEAKAFLWKAWKELV